MSEWVYRQYKTFLIENNFRMITTEDEYCMTAFFHRLVPDNSNPSAEIIFECKNNHINKLKESTFKNKKSKYQDHPENMCLKCLKNKLLPGQTTLDMYFNNP